MYWKYMITFYFLWLHHMTFLESKWNNFENSAKVFKTIWNKYEYKEYISKKCACVLILVFLYYAHPIT